LDVEGVHVDSFEADYELFELLSVVSDDIYVCVSNIKLVFPF
jgi:hypothetical protein